MHASAQIRRLLFLLLHVFILASNAMSMEMRLGEEKSDVLHHWAWSRGSGGHIKKLENDGGGLLCLYTAAVQTEQSPERIKPHVHEMADTWLRCGQAIYCEGCGFPRARLISKDAIIGGVPLSDGSVPLDDDHKFLTLAILWQARNGPVCPVDNCVLEHSSGPQYASKLKNERVPTAPVFAWHRMIGELDAIGMLFTASSEQNPTPIPFPQQLRKEARSQFEHAINQPTSRGHRRHLLKSKHDKKTNTPNTKPTRLSASDSQYISLLQAVSRIRAMERSGVHVSAKTVMEAIVNPVAVQYQAALPDTLYAYLHYKIAAGVGDAIRQTAEDAESEVVGLVLNTPIKTMAAATHQGAGLAYDVMWQVREAVTDELVPLLSEKIATRMAKVIPGRVSREVTRGVHATLTRALTQSMARGIMEQLSLSLTRRTTRQVSRSLLPTLTLSLNSIVAQSLTRNPKSDYYAELCDKHSVYCKQAHDASTHEAHIQYFSGYYATYFSTYFSHYYGGAMSDAITEEYLAKQGRSDRLYGGGSGDDQYSNGAFSNTEISVGASQLGQNSLQQGSIQGAMSPKRKTRSKQKDEPPSRSDDAVNFAVGSRSDSIESVAKRGQRLTTPNDKTNKIR